MGSDPTAAGGGEREESEWLRSARNKATLFGVVSAGNRNRGSKATQICNLLAGCYHTMVETKNIPVQANWDVCVR